MPLGIVSDDDFFKDFSSKEKKSSNRDLFSNRDFDAPSTNEPNVIPDNKLITPSVEIIPPTSKGRSKGDVNVPPEIRKLVAHTAINESRGAALDLAKSLGLSASSVAAYTKGATSTISYHNPTDKGEQKEFVKEVKGEVSKKARNIMMKSMNHMTDDKFNAAKLETLSVVARNMASIMKDMSDENDERNDKPVFVIMQPEIVREEVFEVIELKEP